MIYWNGFSLHLWVFVLFRLCLFPLIWIVYEMKSVKLCWYLNYVYFLFWNSGFMVVECFVYDFPQNGIFFGIVGDCSFWIFRSMEFWVYACWVVWLWFYAKWDFWNCWDCWFMEINILYSWSLSNLRLRCSWLIDLVCQYRRIHLVLWRYAGKWNNWMCSVIVIG